MSADQELLNLAGAESESQTLFDELAGLVPAERQAEYYRVIAHTRTLSPNDEMLRYWKRWASLRFSREKRPRRSPQNGSLCRRFLKCSASQGQCSREANGSIHVTA